MRNALLAGIIAFAFVALSASAFAAPTYLSKPWFIPSTSIYYGGYAGYNPYYNYSFAYPLQTMHSSLYPGGVYTNTPYGTVAASDGYYSYYGPSAAYYSGYGYPYAGYSYGYAPYGYAGYSGYSIGYRGNCFGSKCAVSFACYGSDC